MFKTYARRGKNLIKLSVDFSLGIVIKKLYDTYTFIYISIYVYAVYVFGIHLWTTKKTNKASL